MKNTNPAITAAARATTRTAAVIAFLFAAACADDPQTPSEHQNELIEKVNADRVSCDPAGWGGITDCARVCSPRPTGSQPPNGPTCYTQYVVTVEGVTGYCVLQPAPDRVDWLPCGVR